MATLLPVSCSAAADLLEVARQCAKAGDVAGALSYAKSALVHLEPPEAPAPTVAANVAAFGETFAAIEAKALATSTSDT